MWFEFSEKSVPRNFIISFDPGPGLNNKAGRRLTRG